MPKKPVKIEVVEEGDERFLLKVFLTVLKSGGRL
jgi:hypothetical protein